MIRPLRLAVLPLALVALPLAAQSGSGGQTIGYQWLQAVKAEDTNKLLKLAQDRSVMNSAVLDYQADGEGAIHVAVRKGNKPYLEYMLGLRANPDLISEKEGETPLTLAVLAGRPDVVETLLRFNARVDRGNRGGETPLIKAVRFRRADMAKLLLDRGADPDKADYTGKSARGYAAEDTRNPALGKLLAAAPKRTVKPTAGPRLN